MCGLMDYCQAAVERSWQLLPQYGLSVLFAAVRVLSLEISFFG